MRFNSPLDKKTNRWWRISLRTIIREVDACRAAGIVSVEEIRARVDRAYPFGERKYWPYKEWLAVRKEMFFRMGLRTAKEREAESRLLRAMPLFGGDCP